MFQLVMPYNELISIKMDSVMPVLYEAFEKTKISMGLDSLSQLLRDFLRKIFLTLYSIN